MEGALAPEGNRRMIFDSIDNPEKTEAIELARKQFLVGRKRAIVATVGLFLSCGSVVPFVSGQLLHSHWESIGKYLVFLSMALILIWSYFVRAAVNSYAQLSGMENEY
jgi:hypothetical protein